MTALWIRPLVIATRASPLAMAQAEETARRLREQAGVSADLVSILPLTTTGDRIADRALNAAGGKGLFTKEIEEALLERRADVAVHSMKDAPTETPEGLAFAAHPPREDVRDAFVSRSAASLMDLPEGARIGTASLRRQAQTLRLRPDLKPVLLRGNVQTRLKRLEEGVAEATFLAMAGLNRLGLAHVARGPVAGMLPAVAQGALGLQIRAEDSDLAALLQNLHDRRTGIELAAERAFLKALDGSCRTPLAGLGRLEGETLRFEGEILTPDGRLRHHVALEGPAAEAEALGREAGERLRAQGGSAFFAA